MCFAQCKEVDLFVGIKADDLECKVVKHLPIRGRSSVIAYADPKRPHFSGSKLRFN
jgi:hypothetical protein